VDQQQRLAGGGTHDADVAAAARILVLYP